ncbi:MAG: 3-deoxy-7-phosphoheptulonate synthase [Alkalibacterium thalassium]|uniref:3-deoxy-D-arabinoheptulosonate-7-phosphate synthase n=1 Tax=Alkalibacterium pelagium TaxID=426702 RepID=A0A1H7KCU1_9LACT|nr:3-deoxy-7-phosphoheptulonate synthase [Alkalibacterium pelagium]MCD8505719.1 3-deoxy-7-phosphoheptulonate synthase [Alkalibacterium thalassium]GEN50788.1 3-deoxy-7-phosphoheptulonate synthase [Alkalibacterium pelagium]SEK84673.1 3-deoxy-D-arabinoheptulosonate-7-phosphate synthase [Alkalibacterium pelagium]
MIIVLKQGTGAKAIKEITKKVEEQGVSVSHFSDIKRDFLGVIGDTSAIDTHRLQARPEVEQIVRVEEPYKRANRKFHPENSIIEVGQETIGGDQLGIIAGPCSVESEEQIVDVAKRIKKAGANFLRGGAFKPRTSPYSFQGLELEGLRMLQTAKAETGLPIVTELMSTKWIDEFVESVDMIQIGARNMQNFDLLKEVGKTKTPVLLKRGLSATYKEWLMSAEYIMSEGNENVILCERGVRTFEPETRNTLDIQAVPVIKKLSHLPIIIDPSHAGGMSYLVEAGAKSGIVAGADGLMIEVHNDPENAWSDGEQCLTPDEFGLLMEKAEKLASVEGRTVPLSTQSVSN